MNQYRIGRTGASKATPSTLCQKCLKRDTYECKASAQERPYISRPSRTQILNDPKLLPQLTSDVPNDLLRKKGVADEQLAKAAEERGRKRSRDTENGHLLPRKRSRSVSSYSSGSVSSYSTNLSRDSRESRNSALLTSQHPEFSLPPRSSKDLKRRRHTSSVSSSASDYSDDSRARNYSRRDNRNTRRRRNSVSPGERGRHRSLSSTMRRREPRYTRSRSMSRNRRVRRDYSESPERAWNDRGRRPASRSPLRRRNSSSVGSWSSRSSSSRSRREERRSERMRDYSPSPIRNRYRDENRERRPRREFNDRAHVANGRNSSPRKVPPPRKERSLSPFSKRLALTQAMNNGNRV